jgi:hypothetical protein
MKYIPQYKVNNLKIKIKSDIESLERQAQSVTTTSEFNTIQTLIGEKEKIVNELDKLIK